MNESAATSKSTIGIEFAWNIDDSVSWKGACGRTKWARRWSHCCTRKAIFIYLLLFFVCGWKVQSLLIQLYFLSHSLKARLLTLESELIKRFILYVHMISFFLFIPCNTRYFFYQMQFLEIHTDFVRETNDFCRFYRFSFILWRILQLYLIYKLLLYRLLC